MEALYKTNINWFVFLGFSFLVFLIPGLSLLGYFAILVSLHQFLLLFYSVNYIIPIRYLFGFLMTIQFLIGPTLAYNGFDQYQYFLYKMQIPEVEYFSYALPAVICFILGLHINSKLDGELLDIKAIQSFIKDRSQLPIVLIGVGFVSSFVAQFMASELGFVFYLLGGFKFIGVFILICSNTKLKVAPMAIVYISVISSSLSEGMFHDLIMWTIFLGLFYAVRYKPNIIFKIIFTVVFIIIITLIQILKADYRTSLGSGDQAGLETLNKAYEEKQNESGEDFLI